MQLTTAQRELIERLGVFYQQSGFPPTESRIMALLIVGDEPELTFDQIRDLLSISKSATSTALNLLLTTEKVVYKTRAGDRKRYFTSNIMCWEDSASSGFNKMLSIAVILKEVLAQRTPNTPDFNKGLENLIGFLQYLGEEMPRLMEGWRNRQQGLN